MKHGGTKVQRYEVCISLFTPYTLGEVDLNHGDTKTRRYTESTSQREEREKEIALKHGGTKAQRYEVCISLFTPYPLGEVDLNHGDTKTRRYTESYRTQWKQRGMLHSAFVNLFSSLLVEVLYFLRFVVFAIPIVMK